MPTKTEMGSIYNLPGEGFVVELREGGNSMLFDLQGLQYRIVKRKQQGADTTAEEEALLQINNLGMPFEY